MRRIAVAPLLALALLAAPAAVATDADEQTLHGEYDSGYQDDRRPLTAVFTRAGDDRFEVTFHFRFNGRAHEYRGTAVGSLGHGELRGRVQNESKQRTFTFAGTFDDDGVFRGTHAEIHRGGRERRTGDLTLGG